MLPTFNQDIFPTNTFIMFFFYLHWQNKGFILNLLGSLEINKDSNKNKLLNEQIDVYGSP